MGIKVSWSTPDDLDMTHEVVTEQLELPFDHGIHETYFDTETGTYHNEDGTFVF